MSEPASTPDDKLPPSNAEAEPIPSDDKSKRESVSPKFLLWGEPTDIDDERIKHFVNAQIAADITGQPVAEKYNVVILFDEQSLSRSTTDRIYQAMSEIDSSKPVLLILNTSGGDIAAAYFIAKICREHSGSTFEVAVPRRAKSAGTLICCGADRIHMGSLSELGPIDPQFGPIPALALKHSIEHMAELVTKYPDASTMFSDYLKGSLRIEALGYFERVAKSAAQYGIRLLNSRLNPQPIEYGSDTIADKLVYTYKDHGFAIDSREARDIFGDSIIACNTAEYKFSNQLFQSLDFLSFVCKHRFSRDFSWVGSSEGGCWLLESGS